MSDQHPDKSETQWIEALKAGDPQAAHRLWDRHFDALVRHARKRLDNTPRRAADEEDVALSVFDSLCNGMARGRFDAVKNRDELWYLLLAITNQKVVDQVRRETRQKRGGGEVRGESVFFKREHETAGAGLDAMESDEPAPEFLAEMDEQFQRLLSVLRDDELRSVAVSRMEGYTTDEISGKLNLTTRSIRRKLELIRSRWARELAGG